MPKNSLQNILQKMYQPQEVVAKTQELYEYISTKPTTKE